MRAVALLLLLSVLSPAQAQIYTCVAEDGTRVFSDEKCGPDAKVVKGVTSKKRPEPKSAATPKPKPAQKSVDELKALSAACDGGDMKACKEWTLGGGPNLLKKLERQAETECEAGSLGACEERYCRDRIDDDCRSRVLRTAKLAGETWYLRAQQHDSDAGLTRYEVRCVPPGQTIARDITIQCRTLPGPNRCFLGDEQQGHTRLDRAAAKHCAG